MKTHIDANLEKIIGMIVKVTFFDGTVETGLLMHNTDGRCPYKIVGREYDCGFYKSHVKKISVVSLKVF